MKQSGAFCIPSKPSEIPRTVNSDCDVSDSTRRWGNREAPVEQMVCRSQLLWQHQADDASCQNARCCRICPFLQSSAFQISPQPFPPLTSQTVFDQRKRRNEKCSPGQFISNLPKPKPFLSSLKWHQIKSFMLTWTWLMAYSSCCSLYHSVKSKPSISHLFTVNNTDSSHLPPLNMQNTDDNGLFCCDEYSPVNVHNALFVVGADLEAALLHKSSQFPCPSVLEEGTIGLRDNLGKLYITGHRAETFRHQRLHNASSELLDGLPLWPSRKWRETWGGFYRPALKDSKFLLWIVACEKTSCGSLTVWK